MKKYNSSNFFKHTFCIFNHIEEYFFKENIVHFKSKSESLYSYTKEGVYRYSNHWGRVANCRWKLNTSKKITTQSYSLGFAKWSDFYSINEDIKLFYITVDYQKKHVDYHHKNDKKAGILFIFNEAQKRVKQIRKLLKEEKWALYFNEDIGEVRFFIISKLISSNLTLQEIKMAYQKKISNNL